MGRRGPQVILSARCRAGSGRTRSMRPPSAGNTACQPRFVELGADANRSEGGHGPAGGCGRLSFPGSGLSIKIAPAPRSFAGRKDRRQRLADGWRFVASNTSGGAAHRSQIFPQGSACSPKYPSSTWPPDNPTPRPDPERAFSRPWSASFRSGGARPFVDLAAVGKADVFRGEQRQRVGRRPVAPRAADLLVITPRSTWGQVGMGDPAAYRACPRPCRRRWSPHDQPVLGGETPPRRCVDPRPPWPPDSGRAGGVPRLAQRACQRPRSWRGFRK